MKNTYTFDVARLRGGHSYGNSQVYCVLDAKGDLAEALKDHRAGMRDSITQAYFLHGWSVAVLSASGDAFAPKRTTFTSLYQETELGLDDAKVFKRFFVPYENNHLRAAHYLLRSEGPRPATIRCRLVLPPNASAIRAQYGSTDPRAAAVSHTYLAFTYPDGFTGMLWGSGALASVSDAAPVGEGRTEVTAEFTWDKEIGDTFALSFAASPHGNAVAAAIEMWEPDAGKPTSHLRRVRTLERESQRAIDRHLNTARLVTPDPLVNRGTLWAKINQLRDYQEYGQGVGFSNSPPTDVLVGRDTFWFLMATNYYAQEWSRRLLETWFRLGIETNGKFIEYMMPSRKPLFRDDYGLNINDNTPLMIIASHHYFAMTGDRGFLHASYAPLLTSINYILEQRDVGGELNPHRLIWCTSNETFVRGEAGWRNCFSGGQLSGAVTEINCECVMALRVVADLARHLDDQTNARRLDEAADELARAINTHLKSSTTNNPFYLLMIDPKGRRDETVTGDLLFPVLCSIADAKTSGAIMEELFGPRFWSTSPTGAAGMRTIRGDQPGSNPKADPGNYGLTGGVWPNLALWAGRAAAQVGRPDLLVRGLRGTMLLSDREDFDRCNVTPGEFPEYYNADDLVQRGNSRSTFIHGSYQWAAVEGIMGLTPRAHVLEVNPQLPPDWQWAALQNLPYRGCPLSIFAVAAEHTLYTTTHVETSWNQVVTSESMQQEFRLESDVSAAWIVVDRGTGAELLVASDCAGVAKLVKRDTAVVVIEVQLSAGALVRRPIAKLQ